MKRLELIRLLSSLSEEEVYIKHPGDGLLDEIEIEQVEEMFDGFCTVTPACIALKIKP